MTWLEALILGLIQGLSEFLPISSSGHLELGRVLLGTDLSNAEESFFFTITVHAATALSTIVVFRKDIAAILWDLYTLKFTDTTNMVLFIILSMIPAVGVGLFLKDEIESLFTGNLLLVGSMLLVTAALLFSTSALKPGKGILNYWKSSIIGIAQAIAILPGISRSGATISIGLLLGINREVVARFSFLMVLPVILGAMAKEVMDYKATSGGEEVNITALLIGFMAAFLSGWLACRWMIRLIKKSKLGYFAMYCAAIGLFAIINALL